MSAENLINMMKFAEQAERYDDMVKYAKEFVTSVNDVPEEVRNLLSVAYKNAVGARRSAWRIINSLADRASNTGDNDKLSLLQNYRKEIEYELNNRCSEMLSLIDDYLLPTTHKYDDNHENSEARTFYLKMKGDYYRYLVEVSTGDNRAKLANSALSAYQQATEAAHHLATTHPIKLGLALNLSVYHYEIANDGREACNIAKKAFDDAIAELDNLKEDSYKDSTLIMQLLRDNLTLWTSENENDDESE